MKKFDIIKRLEGKTYGNPTGEQIEAENYAEADKILVGMYEGEEENYSLRVVE